MVRIASGRHAEGRHDPAVRPTCCTARLWVAKAGKEKRDREAGKGARTVAAGDARGVVQVALSQRSAETGLSYIHNPEGVRVVFDQCDSGNSLRTMSRWLRRM